MDEMNAAQAREHIEMVERILAESHRTLCGGGEYFVVWGLYSGIATLTFHFINTGALPPSALWLQVGLLLAAIAFSILRGRYTSSDATRRTLVEREFFNVLWITIGLAFIANVAGFNIFPGIASAAIWSFAEAIVLFYIGLHGNRRALICGIAVVVSMVVANFVTRGEAAYVLAAGMVVGYTGFGIAELIARE